MDATANALNWFEISVNDIARAKKFYEEVFSIKMDETEMMGMKMAFFPADAMNGKVGGGLVESQYHKPSADGAKVYLNANPDLDAFLGKVAAAGGKVHMPKMKISDDIGYMGFFVDTEGNVVAMHSNG
ncbi:MAG TPA: VOC family protein [Mucilaginibacter sp.]|jgi:predicted enzyme related to lactoylglutathione lyase